MYISIVGVRWQQAPVLTVRSSFPDYKVNTVLNMNSFFVFHRRTPYTSTLYIFLVHLITVSFHNFLSPPLNEYTHYSTWHQNSTPSMLSTHLDDRTAASAVRRYCQVMTTSHNNNVVCGLPLLCYFTICSIFFIDCFCLHVCNCE